MKHCGIVLLFLLVATSASATVYLVSDNLELNDAISIVVPGDTIEIEDGVWTNPTIIFDADGTQAAPIVLKPQQAGQVIFSGQTDFRIGGDYLIVTGFIFENCTTTQTNLIAFRRNSSDLANHSRLTECVIKDCNPSTSTEDYKWVGIYGTYNEVDHCLIENKTHEGACVVVWSSANEAHHHIHHNFFGPSPEGDGNGWETIRVGTSSWAQYAGYNLVEHNYFYQRDGEIEIISGKSSHCTYRYNIFKECKGGLTLRHGTDCLVEGNMFFGGNKSGSYGVRTIDRNHTVINNYFQDLNGASSGIRYPICLMGGEVNPAANGYQPNINNNISYNTIVNCYKGIMVSAENDWPVAPDSIVFANNIVSISGAAPVVHNNTPTNTTYIGNFFYRSDGDVTIPATGYVDVDPELSIIVGDSIYRPSSSSPIVEAAVTGWSLEENDFELQSRPASPTVGSDEISSDLIIDRGIYGPIWMYNPTVDGLGQDSHLIEAEDAAWGASWTLETDSMACGFEYLLPPNMSSTSTAPTSPSDLVTFTFSLIDGGIYKVFARTLTTNGSDDSFWVRANNGNWQRWNTINGPVYPSLYQWSQVGHWSTGSTAVPVTFELLQGANTIEFAWREPGARLDKIFVTKEDLSVLNVVRNNTLEDHYSFRYNVMESCPLDTIYFADSTDYDPIPFTSNTLVIDHPLTIVGNGSSETIFDGLNMYSHFINNSTSFNLHNLRLTNAFSSLEGGAFLNSGLLSLKGVIFENNYEGLTPKAFTNYGVIYFSKDGQSMIFE